MELGELGPFVMVRGREGWYGVVRRRVGHSSEEFVTMRVKGDSDGVQVQ